MTFETIDVVVSCNCLNRAGEKSLIGNLIFTTMDVLLLVQQFQKLNVDKSGIAWCYSSLIIH